MGFAIARRFPALTSRDFVIFLVGQFISVIGTWMQGTVQPYLAYRISGRPFDLGLIGFASALPGLLSQHKLQRPDRKARSPERICPGWGGRYGGTYGNCQLCANAKRGWLDESRHRRNAHRR